MGMTYVELIVVLSIFSIMSSVLIFNYNGFQARIDIKNLSSDIALKLVQAQKDSLNGKLSANGGFSSAPSYGVYFSKSTNLKNFQYFADLDNSSDCSNPSDPNYCTSQNTGGEFLENIDINRGDFISKIEIMQNYNNGCAGGTSVTSGGLSVVFKRPNSDAIIRTAEIPSSFASGCVDHAEITVSASDNKTTSMIKVYPSGRIQVN
ncbi:MAG: type II secretion system protein [bacterium]